MHLSLKNLLRESQNRPEDRSAQTHYTILWDRAKWSTDHDAIEAKLDDAWQKATDDAEVKYGSADVADYTDEQVAELALERLLTLAEVGAREVVTAGGAWEVQS